MKNLFLMFAVCSIVLISCNYNNEPSKNCETMEATKEQKKGIIHTIEYYIEGGRQADGSITAKAFTENATMSWVEDGKLLSVPIQTLYEIVSNGKSSSASYEILSLSVEEDIAIISLKTQFGDSKYYDMFSLVKVGDEWKIVSKIYRNR